MLDSGLLRVSESRDVFIPGAQACASDSSVAMDPAHGLGESLKGSRELSLSQILLERNQVLHIRN